MKKIAPFIYPAANEHKAIIGRGVGRVNLALAGGRMRTGRTGRRGVRSGVLFIQDFGDAVGDPGLNLVPPIRR
ncbi:MAG: hypothetical protein GXX96_04560 [Planctomycetaceae bacterium]|nr:hypothetical protein [Planctomycetaceae bacterium]